MKVLTEEEQAQQGAFLRGATTADSRVGLGLSCGLFFRVLMTVQWSRYASPRRGVLSLRRQKKNGVACKSVISAVARLPFVPPPPPPPFFSSRVPSRHLFHSYLCPPPFSPPPPPPYLPHFVLFSSPFHASISEFIIIIAPVRLLATPISYASLRLHRHTPTTIAL